MEKQNAVEIVESSRLLSKAFSGFFKDETIAKEVAFHLADMEPELTAIHGLLQGIKRTGKANGVQIDEIVRAVCIHWKYHGEELEKLVSDIPQDSKSAGAEAGKVRHCGGRHGGRPAKRGRREGGTGTNPKE